MFVFVRIWTTNGFTICSSSVETKPSLFCSFCFRRNFQGIILILFLSQPSVWDILQVETFSAFFLFTKFSLQHILYSFKPQFSIIFLLRGLDFSFFSVFLFFWFSLWSLRLKLVEHNDDIRVVFIITDHQLLRALLCRVVHVLHRWFHLWSFFLTFRRSSRFRFGCLGLTEAIHGPGRYIVGQHPWRC